ncbi:MAG TPA: UDP-N-acetylmuramate dehydrogenase [Candidatus Rifleibacterium sp.]|nr:UDP-N-acetylmuramate dehydrogenase [Candidatus Rifleibacterium sp.]
MQFSPELIQKNVPLKTLVTFKLGGPAEYFYTADNSESLSAAVEWARQQKMPLFILGGGSNLVVSDAGLEGLVIHNRCMEINSVDAEKHQISISSGYDFEYLVELAQRNGLAGVESFAGIPGSIGGAIYGNAGAYGRCIADVLIDARVLCPDGSIQTVDNSFFGFDYRTSRLKTDPHIILSARFQLETGNADEIKAKMDDIVAQRHSKHPPYEIGCAGSFFKNLPPLPGEDRRRAAGAVLEQAGAKKMSCGGASVFEKHANFIINTGNATASDVKNLAAMLKDKVKKEFGIELCEEVLYVGRWPAAQAAGHNR